jgi:LCP family protein required for cell wall assembly
MIEPFSVLLLGVDKRKNDAGRSDTIIVMILINENRQKWSAFLVTRTQNNGKVHDKINHAYAYGGLEMSMNTVEELIDIPIDYVVQVNMEGFADIVDAVGGVNVNNTLAFSNEGFDYPTGNINLSGEEALAYVRMRYDDPKGDFGRQNRQKQVIQAILKEGASVNSLVNYRDIFNALGANVQTSMSFDEMVDVQANYQMLLGKSSNSILKRSTVVKQMKYGTTYERIRT